MPKNRILFLASWYPSRVSPYSGDFIQRHARVAARIADITVLHTVRDDDIAGAYEVSDTDNGLREIIVYYKDSGCKVLNFFKRMKAFWMGYIRAEVPDLVHLNTVLPAGLFALYLKFFLGKPFILSEHWTGFQPFRFRQLNLMTHILVRLILQNCRLVLPVSADLGKQMKAVCSKPEFEVVPNVVDTDRFRIFSERKSSAKPRFLHLSMLDEQHKNISGILRSAKRLVDSGLSFELHIGGNGSLEPIRQFVARHHLQDVIFPFGELSHDEVPAMMANADCFLLFSNYENQPCVQGEAFACGLPFIGTDVGGIGEFLPETFGILIPKGDEDALYRAMESVIRGRKFQSPAEMHRFAEENFSPEHLANRFHDIYNRVMHEK